MIQHTGRHHQGRRHDAMVDGKVKREPLEVAPELARRQVVLIRQMDDSSSATLGGSEDALALWGVSSR